jgi:parallel beta-helix repeat protein
MKTTTTVAAAVIAATAVGGLALSPASAAPSPILTCGSVISQSTRLTADITGCEEYGLVIGAPDITIDLGGHTIEGAGSGLARAGVFNELYANVTVTGGHIRGFARGVQGYQAPGASFERLEVSDTIEAVSLEDSDDSTVRSSHLHHNRTGIDLRNTDRSTFVGNVIAENETQGGTDRASVGNTFARNIWAANGFDGLELEDSDDATVEKNLFVGNGMDGLYAIAADRARLTTNTAIGNDGNGFLIDGEAPSIGRNLAAFNRSVGITTTPDSVNLGHNRAIANGEANCINLVCRF